MQLKDFRICFDTRGGTADSRKGYSQLSTVTRCHTPLPYILQAFLFFPGTIDAIIV
jgi:hypothetical protein